MIERMKRLYRKLIRAEYQDPEEMTDAQHEAKACIVRQRLVELGIIKE
jgi:hypothetical protein